MKILQLKLTFLLFISLSVFSCKQSPTTKSDANSKDKVVSYITPKELNLKNSDIQLVDIRTPQEFASGHIKNAKNINFFDSNFMNEINKLDKNKELYIYCHSGNRSGKAAKKIEKMGFIKIYDLKGGILNWNQNNMKVVK